MKSKQSKQKYNHQKRNYSKIRRALLKSLATGQKNTSELANISKVNWKTTRNHLIFLIGMGYVRRVFDSPQVRIIEITEKGLKVLVAKKI